MTAFFETTDKTLSPYFFIKNEKQGMEQFPLKSTKVKVNIAGVIADIRVTQVYKNKGEHPIEAIYIFPGSTKAAVYGMKMTIGERVIIAKIEERKAARKQYEQAQEEGKSASLLEQHRPNVFQMNVANIMPDDEIKVELHYTELMIPTDSVYEFVYPTVVGPRYSGESVQTEQWVRNPYLQEGEPPSNTFDITATLAAGIPVYDMTCTSHKVNIAFNGPTLVTATLDDSEKFGGNRDYILRYRLAGGKIESGLLLYEPSSSSVSHIHAPAWEQDKEKFFLLMVQPPKAVTEAQIPPREYIFIMDTSGSMHGLPIDVSKKLLKLLIGKLRPTDIFNVLLFSHEVRLFSKNSVPATSQNIDNAIRTIENQFGGGGTRLLFALKKALELPKNGGYSRSMILTTDGYVDVEKECFDYIRNHLGDANLFPFGIGSSSNRYLIEGIAHVSMSEPFIVTNEGEASAKTEKFCQYVKSPVLTKIRAEFERFQVYDVEPPTIPDLLAERPLILFGKWRGEPEGNIQMTGIAADGAYVKTVDVREVKPLKINSALPYLWARHRIALLSDYQKADPDGNIAKEVTQLGLRYNLLTEYTSFIAVDDRVRRRERDNLTTVNQPLPLPDGVSEYAVSRRSKYGSQETMELDLGLELSETRESEEIVELTVECNMGFTEESDSGEFEELEFDLDLAAESEEGEFGETVVFDLDEAEISFDEEVEEADAVVCEELTLELDIDDDFEELSEPGEFEETVVLDLDAESFVASPHAASIDNEVDEPLENTSELSVAGEYENAKQKIIQGLTEQSESKSKFYFNDLAKIVGVKPREAKKLINQMVADGELEYWSSGSTALYGLKNTDKQRDDELMLSSSDLSDLAEQPELSNLENEITGLDEVAESEQGVDESDALLSDLEYAKEENPEKEVPDDKKSLHSDSEAKSETTNKKYYIWICIILMIMSILILWLML